MQIRNIAIGNPDSLISHMSEVNLRARLGDPDKLLSASSAIRSAQDMTAKNAGIIYHRLPADLTRPSAPEKHAVARELTQTTQAMLRVTAATIRDKAAVLAQRGQERADRALGLSNDRLETEIRAYIRDAVKTAEGMAEVSNLSRSNTKVASVIYDSPHFLLGIGTDLAQKMKLDMVEHWAPDAWADLEECADLRRVLPNYAKVEAEIGSTWYNPQLAAQIDTRVQIDG